MQITHNNKTYIPKVSWVTEEILDYIKSGELIETKPEENTCYGIDCPGCEYCEKEWWKEKPTYWYIETSEMKKSEYANIFFDWLNEKSGAGYIFTRDFYGYDGGQIYNGYTNQYPNEKQIKLSPQQWYYTIYDGEKLVLTEEESEKIANNLRKMISKKPDHDKAMEIPEVAPHDGDNFRKGDSWENQVTNSLNLVIKKINNL